MEHVSIIQGNASVARGDACWFVDLTPSPSPKRRGDCGSVVGMAHLNGARNRGPVEKARAISRELRRRSTNAEQLLWTEIRDRRLDGWKFRRQHPLFHEFGGKQAFYIPDFYCHEAKLAIELDGPIHETQREMDSFRSEVINALGIEVIRFKNDEIDRNMNSVLMSIRKFLKSRL